MFESQAIKNILQDIEKIEDEIGNKLSDFEILQVLGQGGFGFVAKVRSKKNLKIYAMKKVDLSKVPEDKKKYYEYENLFMKNLNHPNICRLFSSFRENTNIYMIMEYMDNGDLFTFLKAHIKLKKYIPEEKLWNIFEQCLQGLIYIHSKGIIHRDIKPANILYGSKGECKITDFNVSSVIDKEKAKNFTNDKKIIDDIVNNFTEVGTPNFKAPEVILSEYDDKADVYSLGVTFCFLAYQSKPIPQDEPKLYSKEMYDIIKLMLSPQDHLRPTSKELYSYFIRLYVDKYLHMTGLVSCINCLSCYDSLRNFFRANDTLFESNNFNQKEKEITKQFNKVLKVLDLNKNINTGAYISKPGEDKFNYLLYELRELLYFYGIQRKNDNSAEIEPNLLINFLLNKLHGELNTKIVNKGIKGNYLKKYVTNENNIKQEAYDNYMIFYNSNYKSNISDNFFGMIKIKKICLNCDKYTYSFNMFSYISFKVDILSKAYPEKKNNLTIFDGFYCLNKNHVSLDIKKCVKCPICNIYTKHNEFKQFFNLPKNLIIFFDRGQNYENKDFIDFPDTLVLNGNHVECFKINNMNYNYVLLGIICRVEDEHQKIKFLSFTKFGMNNNYINFEDKMQYNLENIKKCGIVIGLFYYCSNVQENPMNDNIINHLNNNINNNKVVMNNPNYNINMTNNKNLNNNNLNINNINYINMNINGNYNMINNSNLNANLNQIDQSNYNINMNQFGQYNLNNNCYNINNNPNQINNMNQFGQYNFNNNSNNSNSSNGFPQFGQNNFNNNSNNSSNGFPQFGQNNFNNSTNNSSNGFPQFSQNNFNNSSNNSSNGCPQFGQNNFNNNSNNSSNGFAQFGQNNFNNNSNNSSNGFAQFGQNNFNNNSNNSSNGFAQNNNFNNGINQRNLNSIPNNNNGNNPNNFNIGFNQNIMFNSGFQNIANNNFNNNIC